MLHTYISAAVFILCSFAGSAQHHSLVIVSPSGDSFLLRIDGDPVNTVPQCNVKAYDLASGRHAVEVTLAGNASSGLKDSVNFVNDPKYAQKEFTYALLRQDKKLSLQFKSVSDPSGPVMPLVPEAPKATAPATDNSRYGNLYQAKDSKPVFSRNYQPETASCLVALDDKDIAYATRLLKSVNDEERQMAYAQAIVENNCYTTSQLRELLLVFPSEMDRLTIAKNAYAHLSDKTGIPQLLPVFKYQTIKDYYTGYVTEQENLAKQKSLNCTQATDATRFEALYTKIRNSGYDNEKLTVLKKELAVHCLTTAQVAKLTQIFTHDRERLECLKYSYPIVVDKTNATALAEQLQFSDNKQEFLKFISK